MVAYRGPDEMLEGGGKRVPVGVEWRELGDDVQAWDTKRLKIDMHGDVPGNSSVLGLTLTKTPSFVELIETMLATNKGNFREHKMRKHRAQSPPEKLKASNIPALSLQIGSWKRVASFDGDLVAKCYFAKQKLVWEVLCAGLKSKMEIHWLHISAIRATFAQGHPDTLELELQTPPLFYCESSPQPRKHTMWVAGNDFTSGQAQLYKKHILFFQEGTLGKHYEKLLQCDSRLHELSQRPFPDLSSSFIDTIPIELHSDLYNQQSGIMFGHERHPHQIPVSPHFMQHCSQYQSVSVDHENSATMRSGLAHSICPAWSAPMSAEESTSGYNRHAAGINSIAHRLFSEPKLPVHADEWSLLAKMSSFGSALCELDGMPQFSNSPPERENFHRISNEQVDNGVHDLMSSVPSSSVEPIDRYKRQAAYRYHGY